MASKSKGLKWTIIIVVAVFLASTLLMTLPFMTKTPGVGDELLPVNPEWLLEDSGDEVLDLEIEELGTEVHLEEWSDLEGSDIIVEEVEVDELTQAEDLESQELEPVLTDAEEYLVEEF